MYLKVNHSTFYSMTSQWVLILTPAGGLLADPGDGVSWVSRGEWPRTGYPTRPQTPSLPNQQASYQRQLAEIWRIRSQVSSNNLQFRQQPKQLWINAGSFILYFVLYFFSVYCFTRTSEIEIMIYKTESGLSWLSFCCSLLMLSRLSCPSQMGKPHLEVNTVRS